MFFIIVKLNEYAAIAQSVERILGKDEVASSNLASSSKKVPKSLWFRNFFLFSGLYLLIQFSMDCVLRTICEQLSVVQTWYYPATANRRSSSSGFSPTIAASFFSFSLSVAVPISVWKKCVSISSANC